MASNFSLERSQRRVPRIFSINFFCFWPGVHVTPALRQLKSKPRLKHFQPIQLGCFSCLTESGALLIALLNESVAERENEATCEKLCCSKHPSVVSQMSTYGPYQNEKRLHKPKVFL